MKLGNHGKPFSRLIALTITLFEGGRELVTTICKSPVMITSTARQPDAARCAPAAAMPTARRRVGLFTTPLAITIP